MICMGMVKSMDTDRILVMDRGATATSDTFCCTSPTIPFQDTWSSCREPKSVCRALYLWKKKKY